MARKRMAKSTEEMLNKVLDYAKGRAETLGGLVDYYREKERVEGFATTQDKFIYGMSLAQVQEIGHLIEFLEDMFPQGNISDITNNE